MYAFGAVEVLARRLLGPAVCIFFTMYEEHCMPLLTTDMTMVTFNSAEHQLSSQYILHTRQAGIRPKQMTRKARPCFTL